MMIFDLGDPRALWRWWIDGTRDWMMHVEEVEDDEKSNRSGNIRVRISQLPGARKLPSHNV